MVAGDTVALAVSFSGTPPIGYEWRRNGTTLVTFGQGTSILTLAHVQLPSAGIYSVMVTNSACPSGVLSADAILTVLADSDSDHLPDDWEIAFRLRADDPSDGAEDPDGDTMTNLQEYMAGTDPKNALSFLKLEGFISRGVNLLLSFSAVSNKTYTVQSSKSGDPAIWINLISFDAATSNRVIVVTNSIPGVSAPSYYRLQTPRAP